MIARRKVPWHRHLACGATGHLVWWPGFGRRNARRPHRQDVCATTSARVGCNHKHMAALELGERVPMPIEQASKDFRFYLALFHLFIALFVARTIFAIRI